MIKWFRGADGFIVWTHLSFRQGYPEVGDPPSKALSEWTETCVFQKAINHGFDGFLIPTGKNDRIVRTLRNSTFVDNDLTTLLGCQKIDDLVILRYGTET